MGKKEEKKAIKFGSEITELLSKLKQREIELKDVEIEVGELEIWLPPAAKAVVPPPKAKPH